MIRFVKNACSLAATLLQKRVRKWLFGTGGWDYPEIRAAMDIYEDEFTDAYWRVIEKKVHVLRPGMLVQFDNSRYNGWSDIIDTEAVGLLIAINVSEKTSYQLICEVMWDDGVYRRMDMRFIMLAKEKK